jgi:hypothetical protein
MTDAPFDMPPATKRNAAGTLLYDPIRGAWVIRRLMADPRLGITNKIHAAAVVGSLAGESRLTVIQEENPIAGRGGWGWEQATGSRRVALENFGASRGDRGATTDETNYLFLVLELLGSEAAAWTATKKATTLADAVLTFERLFERPSSLSDVNRRVEYAQQALDAMGASDPVPAPLPPPVPQVDIHALIVMLQQALNAQAGAGLSVDGIFGPRTYAALMNWQNRRS